MEERTQIAKRKRGARLQLAGLIVGIVGAGACLPASFFSCLSAFEAPWSLELGYVMFSWLIHWAILLVACKWALVGGVLLILDSSLPATVLSDEVFFRLPLPPFLDALVLGLWLFIFLSLLASGILFILSWREGRKQGETSSED